jgi:hypothetical protein
LTDTTSAAARIPFTRARTGLPALICTFILLSPKIYGLTKTNRGNIRQI